MSVAERLEYLRTQIEAECISYGEIAELQDLSDQIDPSDVLLLQWAGVPEFEDYPACPVCGSIEPECELGCAAAEGRA